MNKMTQSVLMQPYNFNIKHTNRSKLITQTSNGFSFQIIAIQRQTLFLLKNELNCQYRQCSSISGEQNQSINLLKSQRKQQNIISFILTDTKITISYNGVQRYFKFIDILKLQSITSDKYLLHVHLGNYQQYEIVKLRIGNRNIKIGSSINFNKQHKKLTINPSQLIQNQIKIMQDKCNANENRKINWSNNKEIKQNSILKTNLNRIRSEQSLWKINGICKNKYQENNKMKLSSKRQQQTINKKSVIVKYTKIQKNQQFQSEQKNKYFYRNCSSKNNTNSQNNLNNCSNVSYSKKSKDIYNTNKNLSNHKEKKLRHEHRKHLNGSISLFGNSNTTYKYNPSLINLTQIEEHVEDNNTNHNIRRKLPL